MAIRLGGLSSGLDTDALVGALMSAQSLKKTKVSQAKTKHEWKQTKWEDLNTKLSNLYSNFVSKMQLQSSYNVKKATVSDTSKASIAANSNAANGSYTMEVKNIATAQYLTGAKISATSTSAKLSEVDPSLVNKQISIKNGDKTVDFSVTADTKISDFVDALKSAGLNANYDTKQQRFFISSKESGIENAFSITSSQISSAELSGLSSLKSAVGYDNMDSAHKKTVNEAINTLKTSGVGTEEYNTALDKLATASYETKKNAADSAATTYMKAKLYSENYAEKESAARESLKNDYLDAEGNLKAGKTQEDYDKAVEKKAIADTESFVSDQLKNDDVKLEIEAKAFSGVTADEINALDSKTVDKYYPSGANDTAGIAGITSESIKGDIEYTVSAYAGITDRNNSLASSALSSLGLTDISVDSDGNVTKGAEPSGMALVAASDSEIVLNGATLKSSSSVVSANGLDITLTGKTKPGEAITFTVSNDVDAVYDKVKDFLKEYNSILNEMTTAYNAEGARDYAPLTKEQKEDMSDDEIKEWEDKIKGSLLRNDSNLNNIMSTMRNAMMSSVTVDGKKYSLSSFGIMTSTNYMEGGQLHIYGDKDDSVYSGEADKLKVALANDPEATTKALADIFTKLREGMQSISKRQAGTRSALSYYDDIKMKDDAKSYKKQLSAWDDKLAKLEENYYAKFTAMEKAMAQLQSQQSSLAGLFGG